MPPRTPCMRTPSDASRTTFVRALSRHASPRSLRASIIVVSHSRASASRRGVFRCLLWTRALRPICCAGARIPRPRAICGSNAPTRARWAALSDSSASSSRRRRRCSSLAS
eukprot:Amastigsp_a264_30.p5 type:complete len:111 gc:universal Amastigsp_a264_30:465-797(+)